MYGFTENEYFRFGLNENCRLKSIEYKTENDSEYLEFTIAKGDTETRRRYYKIKQAFLKGGGTTSDTNSKEFKLAEMNVAKAILHVFFAFVKPEIIKNALKEQVSFKSFIEILINLLPENYKEIDIDVFMEYQPTLRPGAEKTYLQVPDKVYQGDFITRSKPNMNWREMRINTMNDMNTALAYIGTISKPEGDVEVQHAFKRNKKYMDSNRAKLQKVDKSTTEPNDLQDLNLI